MSFLDAVHLTSLEFGLILLVIILATVLIRSKRKVIQPTEQVTQTIDFEGLKEWVKESESICETLTKNLQEKRKIAKRLVTQLDGKIGQMNELLTKVNEKEPSPPEEVKRKDIHPLIIEMADSGCPVSQIARWLRVSEGEVQLILDLKKFGHREDPQSQVGIPRV
jgi:hypothetical protein